MSREVESVSSEMAGRAPVPPHVYADERAHALAVVSSHRADQLYREIVERQPVDDRSVPVKHGDFLYYTKQVEGRVHWIHCRQRIGAEGCEQIVLDLNQVAGRSTYCRVSAVAVSPDHRRVAYTVDLRGDEQLTLFIRNLDRPNEPECLLCSEAGPTVAWASDGRSLFYTTLDATLRPARVLRHRLGGAVESDAVVYEECDEAFRLSVARTESGAYILVAAQSLTTTEIRYLPARFPGRGLQLVRGRCSGVRYALTHHDGYFYILINDDGAANFRLMRAPVVAPGRAVWHELIPHRGDVSLERVEGYSDHLLIWERRRGVRGLRVFDFDSEAIRAVTLPLQVATLSPGDNRAFRTSWTRFGYSSLTTPFTILEYDMAAASLVVKKRSAVRGAFRPSLYASKRVLAPTADGVEVPISLVYRRDRSELGGCPLVLYAYGAYGHCVEPSFEASRLSLLDRGVTFAIAHVRGGGELGETWHHQGRALNKWNSIEDLMVCAEYLVDQGYAVPGQMAAMGESAGGLLVAAAVNARPDLFRVAVVDCPFVDVLGALADSSLPLTVSDWDEWGDPSSAEVRSYIASYSPCANVKPAAHPAVFATVGLHDPWVPPDQPIRWVEQLRRTNTGNHPILLWIEPAGHSGPSDRQGFFRTTARKFAFILDQLGVDREDPAGLHAR